MPYRILIHAVRALTAKPRTKAIDQGERHVIWGAAMQNAARVEVRSERGLLLFFYPRRESLRIAAAGSISPQ